MVGFGTWGIAGPWKFGWGAVDDDRSIAAVRRAIACGVTEKMWLVAARTFPSR